MGLAPIHCLRRGARMLGPTRSSSDIWGLALVAGMLGLVSLLLLQGVLSRVVTLPQHHEPSTSRSTPSQP